MKIRKELPEEPTVLNVGQLQLDIDWGPPKCPQAPQCGSRVLVFLSVCYRLAEQCIASHRNSESLHVTSTKWCIRKLITAHSSNHIQILWDCPLVTIISNNADFRSTSWSLDCKLRNVANFEAKFEIRRALNSEKSLSASQTWQVVISECNCTD